MKYICLQIADYNMTPDLASLSENLRTCLQESEEVPTDYTQLFHSKVGVYYILIILLICLYILIICMYILYITNNNNFYEQHQVPTYNTIFN